MIGAFVPNTSSKECAGVCDSSMALKYMAGFSDSDELFGSLASICEPKTVSTYMAGIFDPYIEVGDKAGAFELEDMAGALDPNSIAE